jgi:hypothetical protein
MDVSGDSTAITGVSTDDEWYARPFERFEYEGPRRLKRRPYLFTS